MLTVDFHLEFVERQKDDFNKLCKGRILDWVMAGESEKGGLKKEWLLTSIACKKEKKEMIGRTRLQNNFNVIYIISKKF